MCLSSQQASEQSRAASGTSHVSWSSLHVSPPAMLSSMKDQPCVSLPSQGPCRQYTTKACTAAFCRKCTCLHQQQHCIAMPALQQSHSPPATSSIGQDPTSCISLLTPLTSILHHPFATYPCLSFRAIMMRACANAQIHRQAAQLRGSSACVLPSRGSCPGCRAAYWMLLCRICKRLLLASMDPFATRSTSRFHHLPC